MDNYNTWQNVTKTLRNIKFNRGIVRHMRQTPKSSSIWTLELETDFAVEGTGVQTSLRWWVWELCVRGERKAHGEAQVTWSPPPVPTQEDRADPTQTQMAKQNLIPYYYFSKRNLNCWLLVVQKVEFKKQPYLWRQPCMICCLWSWCGWHIGITWAGRRHPISYMSLNLAKSMTTQVWIFVSQAQFQRKIGLCKASICREIRLGGSKS
jgi:hypothetical protein